MSSTAQLVSPFPLVPSAAYAPARYPTLFLVLGTVLLASPFVIFTPHLQDYLNHLARIYFILHQDDQILSQHYTVVWSPNPNLGFDLAMLGLGRLLPLDWAGKAFIVLTFLLTATGLAALHKAFTGRSSLVPLLTLPFFYGTPFTKGFLAYVFGLALAFWMMRGWLALLERPLLWRLLGGAVFATTLYLVHFSAFAVYGMFVAAMTLERGLAGGRWRQARFHGETALHACQALPALTLAALSEFSGSGLKEAGFSWPHEKLVDITRVLQFASDELSVVFLVLAIGLATLLIRQHRPRAVRPLLVTGLLCLAAFFALPSMMRGSVGADWRLLTPAAYLFILAWVPSRLPDQPSTNCLVYAFCCLLTCMVVAQAYMAYVADSQRREFLAVVEPMADGAKLLYAVTDPDEMRQIAEGPCSLFHVASQALPAKRALVSNMFATPGQQPLRFKDLDLVDTQSLIPVGLEWIAFRLSEAGQDLPDFAYAFDYVVLYGRRHRSERLFLPMENMLLLKATEHFRLYRIVK